MRESQPDRYLGVSPVGISAALRLSPARRCACGVRNRSSARRRQAHCYGVPKRPAARLHRALTGEPLENPPHASTDVAFAWLCSASVARCPGRGSGAGA